MFDKKTTKVIQKALKALDKKNFTLIMHGGSFPAIENTGFGTMNSDGAKELIDYISGVFNSIQLGPAGKTKSCDASPYTSTIFSLNPLFADLKELTTKKWGNILSEETFKDIVENNPKKGENRTAYSYAYKKYTDALNEAYKNFIEKADKTTLRCGDPVFIFRNNNAILHRIYKLTDDGFFMKGDAHIKSDGFFSFDDIVGVVKYALNEKTNKKRKLNTPFIRFLVKLNRIRIHLFNFLKKAPTHN